MGFLASAYGLVFAGAVALYAGFYLVPLWRRGRDLRPFGLDSLVKAVRHDLDEETRAALAAVNAPRRTPRETADEATRSADLFADPSDRLAALAEAPRPVPPPRRGAERLARLVSLHASYGDGVVQEAVDAVRAQYPAGAYPGVGVDRLPAVTAFAERAATARTTAGLFVLIGLLFTMVRLNGVVGAIADAAGGAQMRPEQFLATMGALMNGIGGAFTSSIVGLGLMLVSLLFVGAIDWTAAGRVHRLDRAMTRQVIPGLAEIHERLMPALTLSDMLAETSAYVRTLGGAVRTLNAGLDRSLDGLGDRIADMMGDFESFQHQYARLDDLLKTMGEASGHLRDTTRVLSGAARRIGDPLDEFNKTLVRHLETVADAVGVSRDGFAALGEQIAAVALQTDASVGRIAASADAAAGESAAAQHAGLARLAAQSAAIEVHFARLADALGKASSTRVEQSLGRIDRAVDRLAEVEDAPQTLFAFLRDRLTRRRPEAFSAPRIPSLFDSQPRSGGDPTAS